MSVQGRLGTRSAALLAATAVLTALLPIVGAQAATTDCATVLAPAVALSDAQPGYSGVSASTTPDGSGTATSRWNPAQVRASLDMRLSFTVTVDGKPHPFSFATTTLASTHARWASLGNFASARDVTAALALLHKAAPAFTASPREATADEVHASGVWPSHDVAALLDGPLPVTDTAPGVGGNTVYTCSDGSLTARFTVGASGLLDQIAVEAPAGAFAKGTGLLATAHRSAARAREARGLTGSSRVTSSGVTPALQKDTLVYTYAVPTITLPTAAHTTTYERLFTALQAIHLREQVAGTAAQIARLTTQSLSFRHTRATVADVRHFARLLVRAPNSFGFIPLRIGYHPGGVWIAATNPFTGARVAYSVLVGRHGVRSARVG